MKKIQLINSRAPLRMSFAGGGTDVPPFPERYGGVVVNATITKYVTSSMCSRKDKKLEIEMVGEGKMVLPNIRTIPLDGKFDIIKSVIRHFYRGNKGLRVYTYKDVGSRSGLGGSAALFISVIGLLNEISNEKLDKYQIAEIAYELERNELKNLGGKQDQYASVFGGINFIEFKGSDFVRVTPLNLNKETISELEEYIVLFDLGQRKDSGTIIENQIKNIENKRNALTAMIKTKEIVKKIKKALLSENLQEFGYILDDAWKLKKQFTTEISNPKIDKLYEDLKNKGVLGGKISGAGGGGHMFVLCRPFTKDKIEKEIIKHGARIVPFKFENTGLVTWRSTF